MPETVIIVDFGGQYNQLIARRVRENNVYSEVVPYSRALDVIRKTQPKGIIFTGGPASVYEQGAPTIDAEVLQLGIPVLGICYGAQLMASLLGGKVVPPVAREYGRVELKTTGGLMGSVVKDGVCWMSHGDQIDQVPAGFQVTATSHTCPVAAMENEAKKLYAVQFHPEVQHTAFGAQLLHGAGMGALPQRTGALANFAIKSHDEQIVVQGIPWELRHAYEQVRFQDSSFGYIY